MTADDDPVVELNRPVRRRPDPLIGVILGVAAGVVIAAARHPQPGMFVVSAAFAVGARVRPGPSSYEVGSSTSSSW
jgi:hypothetical protein